MATTTNLGLYKPTRDDYISVQRDLSNNYDLIDAAVGQNNALINDMDIIINGNTASVNVTAGQFVTVRNSTITGITDGIYVAKNNVASGTAFTSSNLEQVTGGALNSLNDKISISAITPKPYITIKKNSTTAYVTINGMYRTGTTIDEGYRPATLTSIECIGYQSGFYFPTTLSIYPDGSVTCMTHYNYGSDPAPDNEISINGSSAYSLI